jgi:hypothetical protein
VLGANDVWIGGSTTGNRAFAEHWDGSSWTQAVTNEDVEYTEFNAVAVDASGAVWGAGWQSPGLGSFTFAARLDAGSWTTTRTPDMPYNNTLYGVATMGSRAWVVGYGSDDGPAPLVERWSGGRWQVEPNPGPGISTLYAIARAGRTLWTVGDGLIMRRDG